MIYNLLIGFIIGLGKIIPGVSGSMLAITFGVYDKLIESILNPIKNIKFILSILPGIICAIVFGSGVITYLLNNYYFLTMVFFIGLISGGLPKIIHLSYNKISFKKIIISLISFLIPILIMINKSVTINGAISYPFLVVVGIIESFSAIVPGISGTAILLIIGYYDKVMYFFNNIFNFVLFNYTIKFGIPFFLGIVIGIYVTSKLVNYILKKRNEIFYPMILGLALSSVFLMLKQTFTVSISFFTLIYSFVIITIGFIISSKFDK